MNLLKMMAASGGSKAAPANIGQILSGTHFDGAVTPNYLPDFVNAGEYWTGSYSNGAQGEPAYGGVTKFGTASGWWWYNQYEAPYYFPIAMRTPKAMASPNFTVDFQVWGQAYDYGAMSWELLFESANFNLQVYHQAGIQGFNPTIRIIINDNYVIDDSGTLPVSFAASASWSWEPISVSYDGQVVRIFHYGALVFQRTHTRVASITSGRISLFPQVEELAGIDEVVFIQGARTENYTPWTRAYVATDNPLLPQPGTAPVLASGTASSTSFAPLYSDGGAVAELQFKQDGRIIAQQFDGVFLVGNWLTPNLQGTVPGVSNGYYYRYTQTTDNVYNTVVIPWTQWQAFNNDVAFVSTDNEGLPGHGGIPINVSYTIEINSQPAAGGVSWSGVVSAAWGWDS